MSAPSDAHNTPSAWLADGVRHQIMLRVLPVQRHDVLGPLSVVRMALAIVKRRLAQAAGAGPGAQAKDGAASPAAISGVLDKLNEANDQVVATVNAAAALRWWDGHHSSAPQALADVLGQCLGLVQLAMSLRGQQLALQLERSAALAPVLVLVPQAQFVVLGLLVHATEAHPTAGPWRLRLADDGLWLHADALAPTQAVPAAASGDSLAPAGLRSALRPIDGVALESLLGAVGWRLTYTGKNWRLNWPELPKA